MKKGKPVRKAKSAPRRDTSGMLFVREASIRNAPPAVDGRRLVMVAGVLALPADADLPGEHQFVVSGTVDEEGLHVTVHRDGAIDQTDVTLGRTIDGVLLYPIWRV
jgi:hypothetical protein